MPKKRPIEHPRRLTPAERYEIIKGAREYFAKNGLPWGRQEREPMTFEFNTQGDKVETERQRDRRLRRERYLERQKALYKPWLKA